MARDYRYELLEFLHNQDNHTADIFPLISGYLSDTGNSRHSYYSNFLAPLKESNFIKFLGDVSFLLSVHQNGKYYGDIIKIALTYKGIDEYQRLFNLKDPIPIVPSQTFITHGSHSPIGGRDVNITTDAEDPVLAKKSYVLNKRTLVWIIGLGIITIAIMILIAKHVI